MDPEPVKPRCPRCGYDLGGTVATWTESCPVSGVCAECGLAIIWGDVLNPARWTPHWSYEQDCGDLHFQRRRRIPSTLWRMLWAPGFWRGMRMEFVFRPWRIAKLALVGICLQFIVFLAGYVAWELLAQRPGRPSVWYFLRNDERLWILLWPRTLLGEWWGADVHAWPKRFPLTAWWLMVGGLLVPWCFALLPQSLRQAKVRPRHLVRVTLYGIPVMTAIATIPWVGEDVLSSLGVLSWNRGWLSYIDFWSLQNFWGRWEWPALTLTWVAWQTWWWGCAVTRYMRIPHGWGVAMLLVALAHLVALGLVLWLSGDQRLRFVSDVFR
ncbi:MAG TPA: hypothetical protein VK176_01910 [Phycisphaerales bacterium]|nr:hypothetical protein [Phycisphaerales bacterium]